MIRILFALYFLEEAHVNELATNLSFSKQNIKILVLTNARALTTPL